MRITVTRPQPKTWSISTTWLAAGLVLLTVILYWPARTFDFVSYDDFQYIQLNPHVQRGLRLTDIAWVFTHSYEANWHPITWISHMLDVQLFGLSPSGPHIVNLLLHAANAALLFLFLARFTGSKSRSAFVAALFAWHPLHVESVAWVAERKDVLSAFFGLLTILAYGSFARNARCREPSDAPNEEPWKFISRSRPYWVALSFFVLGLMSKPMLVTLPFALLLLDFWPLNRLDLGDRASFPKALRRLTIEKIPFFALSIVSSVITFLAQRQGGAVQQLTQLPLDARVENALVAYVRYLGKTLYPADLCFLYPHPGKWPFAAVLSSAVLLISISGLVLILARKFAFRSADVPGTADWARALPVGWFWFLGTLVPIIGLVQVGAQSMADRYTYIPLIGLFIALVWTTASLLGSLRAPPPVAASAGVALLVACLLQTSHQLQFWRNTDALFHRALAVSGHNPLVVKFLADHYYNQGNLAREHGKPAEAMAYYMKAAETFPLHSQVYNNMGLLWHEQGQLTNAIRDYLLSIQIAPTNVNARNNLAVAYTAEGNIDEAITQFSEILRLTPNNAPAHNNLGALLARKKRYKEAIEHYKMAIALSPGLPAFHDNLGDALAQDGQASEAIACYGRALALNPSDKVALQRLQALGLKPQR